MSHSRHLAQCALCMRLANLLDSIGVPLPNTTKHPSQFIGIETEETMESVPHDASRARIHTRIECIPHAINPPYLMMNNMDYWRSHGTNAFDHRNYSTATMYVLMRPIQTTHHLLVASIHSLITVHPQKLDYDDESSHEITGVSQMSGVKLRLGMERKYDGIIDPDMDHVI
eukprot:376824_1